MFDVFTEEIEVLIKRGIADLYWYKDDLKKAWLRAGVNQTLCTQLFASKKEDGTQYTKRQLMDLLYVKLRNADYNRRLEISRNFVRILVEHKNFVPQSDNHRIANAETCALKLKEICLIQEKEREQNEIAAARKHLNKKNNAPNTSTLEKLNQRFTKAYSLAPQQRGYELERLMSDLFILYNVSIQEPFKITGEQIDGAIKYDGHYYLVELKWVNHPVNQSDVASLYLKIEGKFKARGIFISMNGYSSELHESIYRGKEIKAIFWDGRHIANLFSGAYSFEELMNFALAEASIKGNIFCDSGLNK